MEILLAIAGIVSAVAGLGAVGVGIWQGLESNSQAEDELSLAQEEFEYQQAIDTQNERESIVAQANSAAMQIDSLEQSVEEAGYYETYYQGLAGQVETERDDALSEFDTTAAKTVGTQKVALALSGAKIDTGTAKIVTEDTASGLASDRSSLKTQYDSEISNQKSLSEFYGSAKSDYKSQISSYTTLLTDIYNSNSDWLSSDTVDEYGSAYDDWLSKVGK